MSAIMACQLLRHVSYYGMSVITTFQSLWHASHSNKSKGQRRGAAHAECGVAARLDGRDRRRRRLDDAARDLEVRHILVMAY